MEKAFQIKDFQDYYITDKGNVYSRKVTLHNNPLGRIKKNKSHILWAWIFTSNFKKRK